MQEESVNPRSQIYIDSKDVDARLKRLGGISRDPLIEAALHGDLERRNTHNFEFSGAPSYKAASSGLMSLRVRTVELYGWHPGEYLGIPVTFNSDETIAIAVTEGDVNVGVLNDFDPKTKALKGTNTTKAADENRLFYDPPVSFWYLLTCSSEDGLFVELSSPTLNEGGHVSGWGERILLGDVRGTSGVNRVPQIQPSAGEPPTVNILRKQS